MCALHVVLICSFILIAHSSVPRPRGVAISKASFYVAGSDFACLDGSGTVPFDHINDDYCDCRDGSDEPGTSACPSGSFHCTNAGHKPLNIPSSRVNDGICDCCDSTDEYDSRTKCENTCKEMGRAAREEAERLKKAVQEGNEFYKEYCTLGKDAKKEKQGHLAELQKKKDDLETKKKDFQELKEEAEIPEKEAKDVHQKAVDDEKAAKQTEKDKADGDNAFTDLDTNGDSMVSTDEMQKHMEFDIDTNGEVSYEEGKPEEEMRYNDQGIAYRFKNTKDKQLTKEKKGAEKAKLASKWKPVIEYLEDKDSVDLETFRTEVWPNIKAIYKKTDQAPQEGETQTEESQQSSDDMHQEDDEDYDYDRDDEEDEEEIESEGEAKTEDSSDETPEYDEATKLLIATADKARADFTQAEQDFKDAEKELNDINHFLGLDLGEDNEYFPLKDMCYEFTDREYTYKFCPFDKATQRSKSGGAETMLGKWGRWDGPDDNKYSVMYLDQGQSCWNGPNRSVKVIMMCGSSNELISASEPSRCEYQYEFYTPAACHTKLLQHIENIKQSDHDEL